MVSLTEVEVELETVLLHSGEAQSFVDLFVVVEEIVEADLD